MTKFRSRAPPLQQMTLEALRVFAKKAKVKYYCKYDKKTLLQILLMSSRPSDDDDDDDSIDFTVDELRDMAKELKIRGYCRLRKRSLAKKVGVYTESTNPSGSSYVKDIREFKEVVSELESLFKNLKMKHDEDCEKLEKSIQLEQCESRKLYEELTKIKGKRQVDGPVDDDDDEPQPPQAFEYNSDDYQSKQGTPGIKLAEEKCLSHPKLRRMCMHIETLELAIKNFVKSSPEGYQRLKNKLDRECKTRRYYHNQLLEKKGNIRVFCRCRPLSHEEKSRGSTEMIHFDYLQNELEIIAAEKFKFDHIFRPEDDQEAVFEQTSPLVVSVLDGFNVCIFAYGQTGTGKTFTMEGTAENRGVNYRTLEKLFNVAEQRGNINYEIKVSLLEIYDEKIRDLLDEDANAKELKVINCEIPGLSEVPVLSCEEVMALLEQGSGSRSVGSTNANVCSSRSHCLLRVTIIGKNLVKDEQTKSRLWLVDLAGSERDEKTGADPIRKKEAISINLSLSTLHQVISSLASKGLQPPYRQSKLTHVLQSSLEGDCKTLMFLHISSAPADRRETLCSLRYAKDARAVMRGPARKQTVGEQSILVKSRNTKGI